MDVPEIARACGLTENTVYIEDINENVNPSNPYPVPKDVNTLLRSSVMPQDHLNYTLTWYASYLCHLNFAQGHALPFWDSFDVTILVISNNMVSIDNAFILLMVAGGKNLLPSFF